MEKLQRSISWRETSVRHLTVIFFKLWMSANWQNYCNSKACITRLQYVFLVSLSFEARRKWSIKVSIRFPDQKNTKIVRFSAICSYTDLSIVAIVFDTLSFFFAKKFSTCIALTVNIETFYGKKWDWLHWCFQVIF